MLHPNIGPVRWLGAGLAGFGVYLYLWSVRNSNWGTMDLAGSGRWLVSNLPGE